MKTSQDFNENFNQYSSEIEKAMSNLNRMLQEFASNGVVAQQIINPATSEQRPSESAVRTVQRSEPRS